MNGRLFNEDPDNAWHLRPWTESVPGCAGEGCLVIQPIYSFTNWGDGWPLDAEEVVGSEILRRALAKGAKEAKGGHFITTRVLPPFRFVPAQSVGMCFAMDIEEAHSALGEILTSVALSGFRRIVLFNVNPLLEEWVDVAARDLRVDENLEMFCLNLAGLGLDFHPQRGGDRSVLSVLLEHLIGPIEGGASSVHREGMDPLGAAVNFFEMDGVVKAHAGGDELLDQAADRLAHLLKQIERHPRLPERAPYSAEKKGGR